MKNPIFLLLLIILFSTVMSCKKDNSKSTQRYCQVVFYLNQNNGSAITHKSSFFIDNIPSTNQNNNNGYGGNCHIGSVINMMSDTVCNAGIYILRSPDFILTVFNGYNDTIYSHLYGSTSKQNIFYTVQ